MRQQFDSGSDPLDAEEQSERQQRHHNPFQGTGFTYALTSYLFSCYLVELLLGQFQFGIFTSWKISKRLFFHNDVINVQKPSKRFQSVPGRSLSPWWWWWSTPSSRRWRRYSVPFQLLVFPSHYLQSCSVSVSILVQFIFSDQNRAINWYNSVPMHNRVVKKAFEYHNYWFGESKQKKPHKFCTVKKFVQ